MKKQLLLGLLTIGLLAFAPSHALAEDLVEDDDEIDTGVADPPEAAAAAARGEPVYFELQVRNLPSGGRSWSALRPVDALGGIDVRGVDTDRDRVIIRVRGTLDRNRLETALAESGIMLVYIERRNS
ncbi:hypothetical protein M0534_00095 [Methylonatrum kenyense]|uniref:hypothetical protein n=1 Tax=Methylonatrum kenyense TaxID=455253 RepID=UPI0020C17970|nr:hypothetical protein [Methylonatrum kenyense]MCK8514732.1 hypothetical protein [Methylonatrum kenyense]